MAKAKKQTIGKMVSNLIRDALQKKRMADFRNEVPVFKAVKGQLPMGIDNINELR